MEGRSQYECDQKVSFSTPTLIEVDGQKQVISSGSGFVAAYDPADGRELWRVRYGEGYSVVPEARVCGRTAIRSFGLRSLNSVRHQPEGAAGDVTETHVVWKHEKGSLLTPSVIVIGDELYMVSDNGVASCLDAKTGTVHWTKRLGGDYSASPIAADGNIYFQNEARRHDGRQSSQRIRIDRHQRPGRMHPRFANCHRQRNVPTLRKPPLAHRN